MNCHSQTGDARSWSPFAQASATTPARLTRLHDSPNRLLQPQHPWQRGGARPPRASRPDALMYQACRSRCVCSIVTNPRELVRPREISLQCVNGGGLPGARRRSYRNTKCKRGTAPSLLDVSQVAFSSLMPFPASVLAAIGHARRLGNVPLGSRLGYLRRPLAQTGILPPRLSWN